MSLYFVNVYLIKNRCSITRFNKETFDFVVSNNQSIADNHNLCTALFKKNLSYSIYLAVKVMTIFLKFPHIYCNINDCTYFLTKVIGNHIISTYIFLYNEENR